MALISVDELAGLIDDPGLVVCDVRFHLDDHARGRREYDSGHLPGARFVDLHTELAGSADGGPGGGASGGAGESCGGGRHPLPALDEFVALLERLGVTTRSTVVAYDSAGGATASRLWWMLRSIGHDRALVLDGGVQAWEAAGHELTVDVPSLEPTTYPTPPGWSGTVDADDVVHELAAGTTVIDARSADRFRGEVEPIDPRAGHIPGAINRFHGDTIGADGLHLDSGELAAQFTDIGPSPIVYCGSGVTACHDLLALSIIGVDDARLYPGSWSEWSSDPDRPIATGD